MPFAGVGGTSVRDGQYLIDNSLRFNDDDSAYLSRTPASAGNRKTWTWSGWVKLGNLSAVRNLFSSSSVNQLRFNSDNSFFVYINDSTVLQTNALYRDTASWYHIIIACDTTQSTASNRTKLYVNGTQITSFATENQLAQNTDTGFNNTTAHTIGRQSGGGFYFDGYMAEVHFIDGQALSPTSFGEFDADSGIWKPKQYSGSYGTNGFYLDFENSGSLGADQSGNGNDFTPTNLASTDQTTDTPTNNFCTLNPLFTGNGAQLAEANTKVTLQNGTAGWTSCASTIALPSVGKYYAEFKVVNYINGYMGLGFYLDGQTQLQGSTNSTGANNANWWSQAGHDSNFYNNGVAYSGAQTWSSGILMLAHDADTGKVWWGHNGTWFNSGNPATGTNAPFTITRNGRNLYMIVEGYNGVVWEANFGNPPFSISSGNADDNGYGNFEYAPPSGYLALCTQNLATELSPTIDDGSEYFNTVLYTGNGGTNAVTGVGFKPDWIWVKERSSTSGHRLADTTRGATKSLSSNDTGSETTNANIFSSLDSDGFTQGADNGVNESGQTYASWNWKANAGSTSSNTDGSITSTVQANTTAGFSIVTYTGNGTSGATIGHGLGVQPSMVMVKARNVVAGWYVEHIGLTGFGTRTIFLNETSAESAQVSHWNNTAPTSSVFTVGNSGGVNQNTKDYIAYCFAEIEGYSKFGSYTGNGSTNGPFVYTGFRPAFVIYKRTDAVENWQVLDSKRDIDNPVGQQLYPNLSATEGTENRLDFTSNGFKLRNGGTICNASGGTYIYMAFAENPFVSSTGIPVVAR
jgi:hypothetical protein